MSNLGLGQSVGDFQEIVLTPGSALNAFLVPVLDVSLFRSFSLQLTGVWNANIQVLASNDKANFINATVLSVNTPTGGASNIGSNNVYFGPIAYRYLAIQIQAYTSGTVTGVLELYTLAFPPTSALIAAGSASIGTVGLNAGNNTIGAIRLATNNAPVAVGAGNTIVKASAGELTSIVVTTAGTTGFTVFDNAATNAGTQLYNSKTAPALGDVYLIHGHANNGIVVQNTATGPALTVFFN